MLRATVLAAALLLVAAAPAAAAIPIGGASYRAHDHETRKRNWHVEAQVDAAGRSVRTLVLYAEWCGGHTPVAERVEVGPVGDVAASGTVGAADAPAGTYEMAARFVTRRRLEGSFRILDAGGCDTGPIAFVARTKTRSHGHAPGSGPHSHHRSGPPMGTMPDLEDAKPRRLAQAKRLWRASLRSASRRFPGYGDAIAQGYARTARRFGRPVIFHLRSRAYEDDRAWLDPWRPESLVYYWPGRGEPILVAYMFRRPVGRAPRFASPLLAWHSHTHKGRKGRTQMSHVWLTNGLKSAMANCMPVRHLEHARGFRFRRVPTVGAAHESKPCPER